MLMTVIAADDTGEIWWSREVRSSLAQPHPKRRGALQAPSRRARATRTRTGQVRSRDSPRHDACLILARPATRRGSPAHARGGVQRPGTTGSVAMPGLSYDRGRCGRPFGCPVRWAPTSPGAARRHRRGRLVVALRHDQPPRPGTLHRQDRRQGHQPRWRRDPPAVRSVSRQDWSLDASSTL